MSSNSGGMATMKAFILAILTGLFATASHAAGLQFITIPADASGPAIQTAIWTPCAEPASDVRIGPYDLKARRNCPTNGAKLPLIVISHGHGGSNLGHHDLAETLADAGFVVAAINHPGDTHADMSRADQVSEFVERPTEIKRLIDYMLNGWPDAATLDAHAIGFFGFSRGGFTGLVLAGAVPDFMHSKLDCPYADPQACDRAKTEAMNAVWTHDARIRAYVIADPFSVFPTPDSLRNVKQPIQLWASEYGGDGVLPEAEKALAKTLPVPPEFHVATGAAHFVFLAPCPADMARDVPAICVDANGFDRASFHQQFDEQALRFFRATLDQGR
jgi:predicted dienelactone hydrolase